MGSVTQLQQWKAKRAAIASSSETAGASGAWERSAAQYDYYSTPARLENGWRKTKSIQLVPERQYWITANGVHPTGGVWWHAFTMAFRSKALSLTQTLRRML